MRPITLPGIEEYVEAHTSPESALLAAVAERTRRISEMPQMMVGGTEGRFLEMLVFALCPQRVLEIGTFTGYSALSMAATLPPEGHIFTCEIDERHAVLARRNIAASPHADCITIVAGPALPTVEGLDGPFDLVFIDADKVNYLNYFEAVLPKLSVRGLIAVDNTLWNGDVLAGSGADDAETAAIRRFNDAVAADPRVVCVLLTVRDGVTLVRRA